MDAATVSCPACGEPVPSGKRFCGNCGSPLAPRCPSCGAENRMGMRFCEECGTPLTPAVPAPPPQPAPALASPSAAQAAVVPVPRPLSALPQDERRLATALFCDLVGFTPLSDQLDPEEVRDLQAAYFGEMTRQIERYSGTVEKNAGDAVLALFGAPMAHEDDAERAVLCALGMQAAIGPVAEQARSRWQVEPSIRVGVNTGEVVSGLWEVPRRYRAYRQFLRTE